MSGWVEGQYTTKGADTFPKVIMITQLELELTYSHIAAQNVNHNATEPPQLTYLVGEIDWKVSQTTTIDGF